MTPGFRIREARATDADALFRLLPRLAAFDVPATRNPADLWRHDTELLRAWLQGDAPACLVHVAVGAAGELLGFVMTSLRPELLSSEPSAHLEAIAVNEQAQGQGIASALIEATEAGARLHGARTMTLHVFRRNRRARELYQRAGYDEEIIRCTKPLLP